MSLTSTEIRNKFFEFFEQKGHQIVPSAPMVNKDDPTLMFTNAGMNQFKDYFLGNKQPINTRVADTQKCLRVSGKHNDLEEVGRDSYHHTMFEMLGNWSFGDYFKKEAIEYAWELLTTVYQLPADRLYVSVFAGDQSDGLPADEEAAEYWKAYVPEERILYFDKKDNFWEMGETGPCGPCSEIHIDLRDDEQREAIAGKTLVNADHPLVIEIWNLVFIQFDRKANGSLQELPQKHIDTGMGFERLCMAIQGKKSNYDTDVFSDTIQLIEKLSGKEYEASYNEDAKKDIAFRVISDHIRAVSFAIADGQLPSNTGAGYVIRRILRRAVRYYYSFLDRKEPLLHELVPLLSAQFAEVFPELKAQQNFIAKIILEEEKNFLRTLEGGLRRLNQVKIENKILDGETAFELYDTYGFPLDLTEMIGQEEGWKVDHQAFEKALEKQKSRSRNDAAKETGDWIELQPVTKVEFVGYDQNTVEAAHIAKYRKIKSKKQEQIQVVLDRTPFYAESGGQVGDIGSLQAGDETIQVKNTQKENDLIIHVVDKLPSVIDQAIRAKIDIDRRSDIERNHSATHLLHAALKQVLGNHVQQKGSLVQADYLRFDFSHFERMSQEQINKVEKIVNQKIQENIPLEEQRSIPIAEAEAAGATMLFGEKYGDKVRMITFDETYSRELCGGCHVKSTGSIGLLKIKNETAIAAGVRRIEAVTGLAAIQYVNHIEAQLLDVKRLFKSPKNITAQVEKLIAQNKQYEKDIAALKLKQAHAMKDELMAQVVEHNGVQVLTAILNAGINMDAAKQLAQSIESKIGDSIICFGLQDENKVSLMLMISKNLTQGERAYHAGKIIKSLAKDIKGGGGGQAFYATAGGKDPDGLKLAMDALKDLI